MSITIYDDELYLAHVGVGHLDGGNSGRYPWGSGKTPFQRPKDFTQRVSSLRSNGLKDTEIVKALGLENTKELRNLLGIAESQERASLVGEARSLQAQGLTPTQIARKMGYSSESSIRSLLDEVSEQRMNEARNTAMLLKEEVDKNGVTEIGKGMEYQFGVSRTKFDQALYILDKEYGYPTYGGRVPQATNMNQMTTITVLGPPGTQPNAPYKYDEINFINNKYHSTDNGETFNSLSKPKSMSRSRLKINYAEDGGIDKDGLIEIRRGVKDLSLGDSKYAQVRILVGKDLYAKGMAVYSDDMPKGIDVVFNTNKKRGTPDDKTLKPIKTTDPDNPFGSLLRADGQNWYIDENGKKQLGLINKVRQEGDWSEWSNKLSSQFLSKQNTKLIKSQLDLSYADKKQEYNEIMALTNPVVKQKRLEAFGDECDSAAVYLKAAALPRQSNYVILPLVNIKDNEVYAPRYKDGEKVALVRHPHGGTFEIPILTVNNKNAEGKKVVSNTAIDAIGINSKVAEQLSGADFDGDSVLVIPVGNKVKISAREPLKELQNFNPKEQYAYHEGMKLMTKQNTQGQMGEISNLITDMTLLGAPDDEIIKAVKHSMVVIDAEKHKLDYKQSEKDNDIKNLKRKWQGVYNEETNRWNTPAGTIVSRAKSREDIVRVIGQPKIDPETGKYIRNQTPQEYVDRKTGKTKVRMQESTKMYETDDAYKLVSESRNPKELLYADYANKMKAMGNEARKESLKVPKYEYSKSANQAYSKEVDSLMSKLRIAEMDSPKQRQAQILTAAQISVIRNDNPDMTKEEDRKMRQVLLDRNRVAVGAKRHPIVFTDKEWEAVQAGAITKTKLESIIRYVDQEDLVSRSTPKHAPQSVTSAKASRMRAMKNSGYTIAEIASALGLSTSTVSKYINDL